MATSGVDIGRRIREARIAAGLTQMELRARSNIEQATISRYERGEIEAPGAAMLFAIAQALGVSIEWLLTGDDGAGPSIGETADHDTGDVNTEAGE